MPQQPNRQPPPKPRRPPQRTDDFERKMWIFVAVLVLLVLVSAVVFIMTIGGVH